MLRDIWEDSPFLALMFLALGLVCLWLFGGGVLQFRANAECLRLGYPASSVTATFDAFCIARIDQTDTVVPLEEARRKGRR